MSEPTEQDVSGLADLLKVYVSPPASRIARVILTSDWFAERIEREAARAAPTPCPVCGGAGIVDTSPPGVEGSAP